MSNAQDVEPGVDALEQDVAAIILAGGEGRRLSPLTLECCKPALPFAGRHRTIDFTLSNCLNSRIPRVAVLAQYRAESLIPYVDETWGRSMQDAGVCLKTLKSSLPGGFRGTADAVAQVLPRNQLLGRQRLLVLGGDHVYRMDYRAMLREHVARNADVTIACVEVAQSEARAFGVVGVDGCGRVLTFEEKPAFPSAIPGRPGRSLVSMGIYVFESETLAACLSEGGLDFGHDILPKWLRRAQVFAHRFQDALQPQSSYWRDVGTIDAYWQVHMDLLSGRASIDLRDPRWLIGGPQNVGGNTMPARRAAAGLICGEPHVAPSATVRRSVMFPDVHVAEDVVLDECIVLPGASIGRGARLSRVIVGSNCRIPEWCSVGESETGIGIRSPGGITVLTRVDLGPGTTPEIRSRSYSADCLATASRLQAERTHAEPGECG
jgi:glucose-1-phosphate adenylyltransferase